MMHGVAHGIAADDRAKAVESIRIARQPTSGPASRRRRSGDDGSDRAAPCCRDR